MRGLRIIVFTCSVLLLLSGCGKAKNNEYTIDDPSPPQIIEVEVDEEPTQVQTSSASPSDQTNQAGQVNEPALTQEPQTTDSAAPAVSQSEVQANDALVDALIKELDDMGSLLDSLDDVQDSDLVVPDS